ncbi:KAT8 regulatory NSL complex subunit 1 [Alosa sapidissima]|uniref:KAT8 regulatory NSL complex subunit 1 n=1 Tax=Alosa sapidissima TaxID=34773 RepID=UPI001C08D945|nr:KAT8 regulatory NSL complex subunit 1 [Alosa sapidissima]XP_041938238.1 KAT8 regulatory NSL complex subunit 1 [Alosa sapidissima]
MAAMAPALTDAPAEAHRIRFKLATPSSDLSPSASAENNSNATNILLCAPNGSGSPSKRRVTNGTDHHHHHYHHSAQEKSLLRGDTLPVAKSPSLGKLQPLVASYLCSDVTTVPSHTQAKESLKSHLQGALIQQTVLKSQQHQNLGLFAATAGGDALLRKRQALEITGGQLQGLLSGGERTPAPATGNGHAMPINGLAKKMAANGVGVVNGGGKTAAGQSTQLPKPASVTRSGGGLSRASGRGQQLIAQTVSQGEGGVDDPPQPTQPSPSHSPVSHDNGSSPSPPPSTCQSASSQRLEAEPEGPPSSSDFTLTTSTTTTDHRHEPSSSSLLRPPSPSTAGLQVQERTQQTQRRQADIEGRLRHLRKRLQVVQAKQVERHVQQQLTGLLDKTAVHRAGSGGHHMPTDPWGRVVDPSSSSAAASTSSSGVANFLRSGAVPVDLERLHASGSSFLHSTETAFDSDATESSSGGESDVEQDEIARADPDKRHVQLWRRAEGRYAVERSAIISHWNWLQAHVSDLEYRIRQQAEIYKQIRASKGAVELAEPAPCELSTDMEPSPCAAPENGDSERTVNPAAEPNHSRTPKSINGIPNSAEDGSDRKPLGVTPDPTCVAARTRPLLSCRRRRLVHPNVLPNLTGKVPKACVAGCGVNTSCLMCGGSRPPQPPPPPLELSLPERLAHLDSGIHPILSLPSDTKLSIHLQSLMKAQGQGGHAQRLKALKKHSLKHKIALSRIRLPQPSAASSKHKHKLGNSHMAAVRLAHHRKSRLERSHHRSLADRSGRVSKSETHTPYRSGRPHERSHSRKRPRELSGDRTDGPRQLMDTGSPSVSISSLPQSTPSPLSRQLSLPNEAYTPLGPGSQSGAPIRRRRGESSFDINNIVIPMSVAATTRVEKLQYKEILTPRWRKVNVLDEPVAEDEEDAEIEDLSDAVFAQLHLPLQEQERSRYSWRALAPAKRRGSRLFKSLDGRTTPLLGGTNPSTPQPSSPDMGQFHVLQDYGPLASPMSPPSPDTPSSRDSHTRCSTPDFTYEERTVHPWDPRTFPLSEEPAILDEPSGPDNTSRNTSGIQSGHMRAESESEPVSP